MTQREFNDLFSERFDSHFGELNNRIQIKGNIYQIKNAINAAGFTQNKHDDTGFAFELIQAPEILNTEFLSADEFRGRINEYVIRYFISKKYLDELTPELFEQDFVLIYRKLIGAAMCQIGFIPEEAVGEIYLTAEHPGFPGKYLRLLESHSGYELRLYGNCMSYKDPFFSK